MPITPYLVWDRPDEIDNWSHETAHEGEEKAHEGEGRVHEGEGAKV